MSLYTYTLPSGSTYQVNVPAGTTQAQADYIFYSQVAAGTFVGFEPGDTITHASETLINFGLTRLQRGTAGVNDQTILAFSAGTPLNNQLINNQLLEQFVSNNASGLNQQSLISIISGLPTVVELPALDNVPIQNAINQADYIQVTSNPVDGLLSQGVVPVGDLSATQTQAVMAQMSALVGQPFNIATQELGVGKYGFSAQQLERAGYIKPGFAQIYCPINPSTQANPSNFLSFLESPSPWTGFDGVYSLNDILTSEALQNKIQERLMQVSYDILVGEGVISPTTPAVTTPSASTGYVYSDTGILSTASTTSLLAINANNVTSTGTLPVGNVVGNVSSSISNFGTTATAAYTAGLGSLSTGAVNFPSAATPQLSGLATGPAAGSDAATALMLGSTVSSDVGALVATASKFGPAMTTAWTQGANAISKLGSFSTTNLPSLDTIASGLTTSASTLAKGALTTATGAASALAGPALAQLNSLAKASQFGVNFSNFSISGLVAKIQPGAAFTNTVNRQTVDAAVTRVIGSDKIASPSFGLPSVASLGNAADITQAKTILSQGQAAAALVSNQVVNIQGQAAGAAKNLFS